MLDEGEAEASMQAVPRTSAASSAWMLFLAHDTAVPLNVAIFGTEARGCHLPLPLSNLGLMHPFLGRYATKTKQLDPGSTQEHDECVNEAINLWTSQERNDSPVAGLTFCSSLASLLVVS